MLGSIIGQIERLSIQPLERMERYHEYLKSDREIVIAAMTGYGMALKYIAEKLRADREIVLVALSAALLLFHQSRQTALFDCRGSPLYDLILMDHLWGD